MAVGAGLSYPPSDPGISPELESWFELVRTTLDKVLVEVQQLSDLTTDMGVLTAGVIRDSSSKFEIDLDNRLITMIDEQVAPVTRIELGEINTGLDDWGLIVRKADGSTLFDLTGLGVNTVGPGQLLPGGSLGVNHVMNNAFDTGDKSGWIGSPDVNFTVESTSIPAGNPTYYVAKLAAQATGHSDAYSGYNIPGASDDANDYFRVVPGEQYHVSAWRASDAATDDSFHVGMHFVDDSFANDQWIVGYTRATADTTWSEGSGTVTVPSGKYWGRFYAACDDDGTAAGDWFFTLARAQKMVSGSLIESGAVIGGALTAAAQTFGFDGAWSATDHDTVAWGAGTFRLQDGNSYSITGSNTGTMSAFTYIYWDSDVSTTAFQTTTTLATAIGDNKVLVCVAQNTADTNQKAYFVPAVGVLGLNSTHLSPASISTNHIQANTITGGDINAVNLSGIFADLGTITAGLARDTNSTFVADFSNALLTVKDTQATPVDRVYVGKLGAGAADYGIEVYDDTGALILGATGLGVNVVGSSQIDTGAINDSGMIAANTIVSSNLFASNLAGIFADLGTINAGLINNAASSPTAGIRVSSSYSKEGTWTRYIDLAGSGTDPMIYHNKLQLRYDGSLLLSGQLDCSSLDMTGSTIRISSDSGGIGAVRTEIDKNKFRAQTTDTTGANYGPGGFSIGVTGVEVFNLTKDTLDPQGGDFDIVMDGSGDFRITDGTNTNNVACVIASGSAASGTAVDGTIWCQY